MPTPMTQAAMNAAMKALADELAKDPGFLGKILYGKPFALPSREPETALYCIGGVANGEWHSVPRNARDWMIPERSTLSVVMPDFSRELEPQLIETRATRYARRRWNPHPDLPIFEFLAPGDWTDDKITDHLTGGKYGCDRRPRPQAPSHPAKASDPGERAGRTCAITIYNAATGAVRTFSFEDAGTRAGEITAWRCWELKGPRLASTFVDTEWPPDAPIEGDVGEGEGVHAFKHPVSALAYMLDFCANPGLSHSVVAYAFGSVDLYGEVIEHEIGYRAQYARVASLESAHAVRTYLRERCRDEELDHMLNAARELYGVAQPGRRA